MNVPVDLVRVHFSPSHGLVMAVLTGLMVVVLVVTAVMNYPCVGWLLILALVATFIAVEGRQVARVQRRLGELVGSRLDLTDQSLLPDILSLRDPYFGLRTIPLTIRSVVRHLAGVRPGTTLRVCGRAEARPVVPIDVPFEPRELDERGLIYDELDSNQLHGEERRFHRDALVTDDAEGYLLTRRVRANIARAGGWTALILPVVLLSQAAVRSLVGGGSWESTVFFALCTVIVLTGWAPRRRALRERWFGIPGGIVVRFAPLLKHAVTARVFRRVDTVLCLFRMGRERWGLLVVGSNESAFATVTAREGEFALRAWLSPVESPPIARLQEVFPGARVVGMAAAG